MFPINIIILSINETDSFKFVKVMFSVFEIIG